MTDTLFGNFKAAVENALPGARRGDAASLFAIAEAHETATHLGRIHFGLAHAWTCLACKCPDATDEHRQARLNYEVDFDVADLDIGQQWLPIIRERMEAGGAAGRWTGTIAPNDADFVRDWLKTHEGENAKADDRPGWAGELLFEHLHLRADFELSLEMVNALREKHSTEPQLVMLGCGPIEDMLIKFGRRAVDAFVPRLKNETPLAYAVACVWISGWDENRRDILAYWAQKLREHDIPTVPTQEPHLRGPHAPL